MPHTIKRLYYTKIATRNCAYYGRRKGPPFPASPVCFSGLVVFFLVVVLFVPVIFLFIPAVILVFFLIFEVPHIFSRLGSKVWILLDIIDNRSAKDIHDLFVGVLAEDLPKPCGQAADLCVTLCDQEWVTILRCVSNTSVQNASSSSVGFSVPRSLHHQSGKPCSLAHSVGVRRRTV